MLEPILDERGETDFLFFSSSEVTEREMARQKFLQAQRMESVGRLAGTVAHDFNNMLTVIGGYAALLADQIPAEDPKHIPLREIRKAAERSSALTGQLLTFSRRQVVQPRFHDIAQLIGEMKGMLERLVGDDVALRLDLTETAGRVRIDKSQFEQVMMNLVVNARDAMLEGGTLRIATASVVSNK